MNHSEGVAQIGASRAVGNNSVIIGPSNLCTHDNCVMIGSNLRSDHDFQIKIGNCQIETSRQMTQEEFDHVAGTVHKCFGASQ